MPAIKKSILINESPEQVYNLARDPERWAYWYANLAGPEKMNGKGEVGTVAEFSYTMLGKHYPIYIEVTEDFTSSDECRWAGMISGMINGSQHCVYKREGGGTEAVIEVEYSVPGSVIGKIANILIIEKLQENSLQQTLSNLKVLCE